MVGTFWKCKEVKKGLKMLMSKTVKMWLHLDHQFAGLNPMDVLCSALRVLWVPSGTWPLLPRQSMFVHQSLDSMASVIAATLAPVGIGPTLGHVRLSAPPAVCESPSRPVNKSRHRRGLTISKIVGSRVHSQTLPQIFRCFMFLSDSSSHC